MTATTTRPVFTGEDVFKDHGIEVYVEYRGGIPLVALEVRGEVTWLCIEEARHLADHLPDKLRAVADEVEAL